MKIRFVSFVLLISLTVSAEASNPELCLYLDSAQRIHSVKSLSLVPDKYKSSAKCSSLGDNSFLAPPDQIEIKGNTRREEITSPLGHISLRWPRKVETLFGRTPVRATIEAANVVNRTISQSAFSGRIKNISTNWEIVFMDENLPQGQIPSYLINNCHPGWMTPPGNIYIVAQRVAGGCAGQKPAKSSVADQELAQVLIHEMAHGIDYKLLENNFSKDIARAEGFATWFTEYASGRTSIINAKTISQENSALAKFSLKQNPGEFQFDGSPTAYARASCYFKVLEKRLGLRSILEVYDYIRQNNVSFDVAVQHQLGWSQERMEKEVQSLLNK